MKVPAKMSMVAMLLVSMFQFHAAAYNPPPPPPGCLNPDAYNNCINQCFSSIGTCFEYCGNHGGGAMCSSTGMISYPVYDLNTGVLLYWLQEYYSYQYTCNNYSCGLCIQNVQNCITNQCINGGVCNSGCGTVAKALGLC